GSYDWTKRCSASRISSGRIVSSAISTLSLLSNGAGPAPCVLALRCSRVSAGQTALDLSEAPGNGAVDDLVAHPDGQAAHDRGVDLGVQVDGAVVLAGQEGFEPLQLGLAQRVGA